MKKSTLLLTTALSGLFLFGCEKLDVEPVKKDAAALESSLSDKSVSNARLALAALDVIDFEAYTKGTILSEVTSKNGAGPVKVFGKNPRFPERNAAMIFNSSVPTGGDPDLGTPHKDFGGPGIGVGGQSGSQYVNNTALGKVLIITEDFDSNDPDDADLRGATFTFDFSALKSVSVYSMYIMDVEAVENSAMVTFYNSSGGVIGAPFVLPKVGDNGVFNYQFGQGVSGVVKMLVNINGSGAIDNIVFKAEEKDTGGCTGTVGYWKNHTKYSSAKRDATWDKIGASGEDTKFFLSGKTYLQVLKTPTGGNAYYILAYQYIAAKLNILRGAGAPTEVVTAIAESKKLFSTYTPAQIAALSGSSALRKKFIQYATLLGKYNNGEIGPGHCD